ncbi:MAG: helix-turn-helix domain-containing protein [Candidatus Protistobacter heckmanni]|nr:helix-turn-helix domain-containing protein [Candidatus Protistobacter heckmanni]
MSDSDKHQAGAALAEPVEAPEAKGAADQAAFVQAAGKTAVDASATERAPVVAAHDAPESAVSAHEQESAAGAGLEATAAATSSSASDAASEPAAESESGPSIDEEVDNGLTIPQEMGMALRQGREAADMSIEDLSFRLKVPVAMLISIEAGALDKLPSIVFARALVRSVAKTVGVDVEPQLAVLGRGPEQDVLEPASISVKTPAYRPVGSSHGLGGRSKIPPAWVIAAAVLALVAIFLAWQLLSDRGAEPNATPAVAPAPAVQPAPAQPAQSEAAPEAAPAAATAAPVADNAASDSVSASASASANPPVNAPAIAANNAPAPLAAKDAKSAAPAAAVRIVFASECWFELLARGTGKAGEEKRLPGAGELQLTLGNPSAVDVLEFRGKPVELKRDKSSPVKLTLS